MNGYDYELATSEYFKIKVSSSKVLYLNTRVTNSYFLELETNNVKLANVHQSYNWMEDNQRGSGTFRC